MADVTKPATQLPNLLARSNGEASSKDARFDVSINGEIKETDFTPIDGRHYRTVFKPKSMPTLRLVFSKSSTSPSTCALDLIRRLRAQFFSVYLLTALLLVTYVYCPCFANVNFKGISNRDTFLFQNFILLQRFKLIIKNMKIKNHFLCMMAIASPLVSCNSHPKFQTSVDVCRRLQAGACCLEGKNENVDGPI